ncbi:MAG TPA: MOSC N-terminal beta barrel domain-containing protein [Devosia sp.]|nr:MOSC N-terminal beta barrel domain-containing protein [Devosia sp.]
MTPIRIAEVYVYPIKSMGGVRLARAAVTPAGSLALDREWIVVDERGHKLWQGDLPKMALSRCRLDDEAIIVSLPGMPDLRVPRGHHGAGAAVSMYGHDLPGIDAGDAAADWLTEAFARPARLVRVGAAAHAWPGLNPVHAVSRNSLDALNAALAAQGDAAVEIERFRPSLVLEAEDETAFFEERYAAIRFGAAELVFQEPCMRCELPNISRQDASRGRQPLKLIGGLSRSRPTAAPASFGIYGRLTGATEIAEGAIGEPLRAREPS